MQYYLIKVALLDLKRRSWDFLRLSLILSFGFSALYTTLSLKSQLIANLDEQAKYLLTSDLAISVRRALTIQEKNVFKTITEKFSHKTSREITLLTVMNSLDGKNSFLPSPVNVKWVDKSYPFYHQSKFFLEKDARRAWQSLHDEEVIYFNKDQANALAIKVNDYIQLFGKNFRVADFIEDDAMSGSRFFSLFPIAFVSLNHIPKNDVFENQTTFFETMHVKWEQDVSSNKQQDIKEEMEKLLTDPALKVSLPKDSSEQNQRLWATIADFLGILTLSSLILSVLGLFTLMRYQWSHEIETHRKLFLLGLKDSERFYLKFYQTNILAMGSAILCLFISYPMGISLAYYLPASMKTSFHFFHMTSFLYLAGTLFLVLNCIFCYLFFSQKISFTSSSVLQRKKSFNWIQVGIYSVIGILCSILIGRYLTRSWFIAIIVVLGLLVLYVILVGLMNLLIKVAAPYFNLPRKITFSSVKQIQARLIFRSWQKNSSLYSMTMSCLGIVYFLLILLITLQVSLKTQLTFSTEKPDLFLFDVQSEDLDQLSDSLKNYQGRVLDHSPMIRGRLVEINNKAVVREVNKKNMTREEDEESRFKFRAVSVSYKKRLSSFEKILEGVDLPAVWEKKQGSLIPISLENRYAKRLKVKLGDTLTFEFQGETYKTIIVNLRYVFWLSLHPNFFIIFPDGVLNDLPQTYLSVLKFTDDTAMKKFTHFIQQDFNHVSLLLLKQTANLILKQVEILLNAFYLISILFLILGSFLWISVIYERLNMEKANTLLLKKIGLPDKSIANLYVGEFMGMLLLIFLVTPLLSYIAARLIANEYFDGLLVWPTKEIIILTIILVLPLGLITKYLVASFGRVFFK